jgi:hypothetical protein
LLSTQLSESRSRSSANLGFIAALNFHLPTKNGVNVLRNGAFSTMVVFLLGCSTQPLEPTADGKRVAQVKVGLSKAEVQTIMARRGGIFNYSTRTGEIGEAWPYADHFNDMCLMVTYGSDERVTSVASIERDKGPNRVALPGGCR